MNRVKIAYVTPMDVTQAFLYEAGGFPRVTGPDGADVFRRIRLDGVPPDVEVRHAFYDATRNAFGLVLFHDSFDEVGLTEQAPVVAVEVENILVDAAGRRVRHHRSWRDHPSLL